MSHNDTERGLVARYLARVLGDPHLPARSARLLLLWLRDRSDALSLPLGGKLGEQIGNYYNAPGFDAATFEAAWKAERAALVASLDQTARPIGRPEPLASNAELLVLALDIPQPDAAWKIIGLVACCRRFDTVLNLVNTVVETAGPWPRAVALLIGEPTRIVEEALAPTAELIAAGLIQMRESDYLVGHAGLLRIPLRVNTNLDRTFPDFTSMRDALLGAPLISGVGASDYEHVSADRDLITAVLAGAAHEGAPGVNILLYGPPGSGKTELAKVAASAAGLSLFAAGEDPPHEGEADRIGRLADLVFAERLLRGERRVAVLFDEMEDVAVHLIRRGGSKVYLNRLLETNPVPTLWTSNDLSNIDPALLRRMTLAIELKRPPATQRARILQQLLTRHDLDIAEADVAWLAQSLDATPAVLENAIRAAKFSDGRAETIERAARGVLKALSGVSARRLAAIPAFDPELTRASQDLIRLADRLVGGSARNFSLCLSGPPGTGKSAFARYLASRLGLEVMQVRASDILGPYLGQSERNIADAFEQAREAGAFLVFDEADSLLLDRRDARHSWEISQVNEMLTWMEAHALPVCFTTNLMDRMDTASLRRFTFHVRFEALDRAALARAWQVFFGLDPAPADGLVYMNLTPGDFAKARKQAELMGIMGSIADLVEMLADISRGKPDARGAFGFLQ